MAVNIVSLNCPGCGARVAMNAAVCEYCGGPITITSFNSVYDMPISKVNQYAKNYKAALQDAPTNGKVNNSIAMCYLKLRLYSKALQAFEAAIEDDFDNSETYFYAAVCLLDGKKAFLAKRDVINKVENYIKAAKRIEPRGIYAYFQAYIKYDYYERKFLNTNPNYKQCLLEAERLGVSEFDKQLLFDLLGVPKPPMF